MTHTRQASETVATLHRAIRQKKIPGLDLLRATAVAIVIFYHLGLQVNGNFGVIIFFVLSGFLITGVLQKEIARTGKLSLSNFYSRRAYRIFPAFYGCWIVALLMDLALHKQIHWKYEAESFFYLADYGRAVLPTKDQLTFPMGISWSLAIEEQFYLLWPPFLLWVLKLKKPVQAIGWTVVGLWLWRAILVLGFHVPWTYAYNAFDTRVDALMVGCWASLAVADGDVPFVIRIFLSSKWLVFAAVVLLAVFESDVFSRPGGVLTVVQFSVLPAITAILLVQLVYWGTLGWPLMEHAAIQFIARISYSIYLYQGIVIPFVTEKMVGLGPHSGRRVLGIAVTTLLALASYYGIEKPFLRRRDRVWARRSVLTT